MGNRLRRRERLRWFHPMGVTTPLVKGPRPMDATTAAMDAKILRIFCENPFLVKIFAIWPPGALRGLSEGPPGGGNARAFHPRGRYHAVGEIAPDGRWSRGDRWNRLYDVRGGILIGWMVAPFVGRGGGGVFSFEVRSTLANRNKIPW